ncbi:hypothetical protein ACP70R_040251 [Stipagrostis hirtigluma subsp. patula]
MEAKVILLLIVVGFFVVASAVLGFIAEANQLTADDIRFSSGVCIYPAKPAYELGKYAAALLLVAQIIGTLAAGYFTCCSPRAPAGDLCCPKQPACGMFCVTLSWILTAVAVVSYVYGMRWNAATTRGSNESRWSHSNTRGSIELGLSQYCQYLKGGVFRRGALLGLAATAFGIIAYILLNARLPAAKPSTAPEPAAGATDTRPDVPDTRPDVPPAAEAVAVPELVFPEVPRHPVRAYGQASTPHRPPQRQPQAAVEVMMA